MTPSDPLDGKIREALADLLSHAPLAPEFEDLTPRRRSGRPTGRLLVAAVALIVVIVTGVALADRGDSSVSTETAEEGSEDPMAPAETFVGRLEIPVIDVDVMFVKGVSREPLELGPGWYPETPLPGHGGNSAIAGHRTTFGAPFLRLDEVNPGDQIVITTSEGEFTYEVRDTLIVDPDAVEVVDPTFWSDRWAQRPTNALTLTTEHPKFSSAERLVVGAELIGEPVARTRQNPTGATGTELAPEER